MLGKRLVGTLGAGLAALAVAASAAPAQAATFTVNTTDSSGPGSLRSAINAAEGTLRRDKIEFAIPGDGVHTIVLDRDLPVLTRPLTIKGYSQAGAEPATETAVATPTIVIDADNAERGLDIGGDEMDIRGLVVRGADDAGIRVEGHDNVIAGNHIGTNAAGTVARPNFGDGVTVVGRDNVIGGDAPAERNVISGNLDAEVVVTDGSGNVIEGNRIGTNAAGGAGIGSSLGVVLESSGTTLRDNLISDHFYGVTVRGDGNTLQGNDIGTRKSGKAALPNFVGILVQGADDNLIGGTGEGEGNLVSGNHYSGVQLGGFQGDPAVGNDVQGNLIGTTYTGRAPLPNGSFGGFPGVSIAGSSGNVIGGSAPGAGNVISANEGDGVRISDAGADANRVLGNWIGTSRSGRRELGNGGSGVDIDGGDANSVGDEADGAPVNTITHNGDDGVTVKSGLANAIVRNAISGNGDLGIDLGADGSTANDPSDLDDGANGLQNGPEIDAVTRTTVEWELESMPDTLYRLEFATCDGPGAGEGQTYLGSILATTDANGDADDTTPLPARVRPGQHVTMTATQAIAGGVAPNLVIRSLATSEFSPCEEVE